MSRCHSYRVPKLYYLHDVIGNDALWLVPQHVGARWSCEHQPQDEQDRHPQEYLRKELLLFVLGSAAGGCTRPGIPKVECGCENSEGEGSDAEGHVEPLAEAEAGEAPGILGLRALTGRTGWHLIPWVLLFCVPSAVQRDNFIPADSCLTHRTHLPTGSGFQPLVQAGPAEQMTTHADNSVAGSIKADVAL